MAKAKEGEVTDLEEMITRWAWEMWDITKTKEQARVQNQFLQFNINWKNVKFHFESPDYDIVPFVGKPTGPQSNVQPQILFRTFFANNTNQDQVNLDTYVQYFVTKSH